MGGTRSDFFVVRIVSTMSKKRNIFTVNTGTSWVLLRKLTNIEMGTSHDRLLASCL